MQAYKQLLLEWQENPRLRIGVLLILLIVISNGLLALNEYRNGLFEEYIQEDKKLIKLHYVQQQTDWVERAESVKNIRLQLENGLWRAETKGLAQANVQTWFNDKIQQLGLTGLEIAGASVQSDAKTPFIWKVVIEIKGTLYDPGLLELLNHIEQNAKLMQIDQLQTNRDLQDLLGVTLQVSCFFQAPDKP